MGNAIRREETVSTMSDATATEVPQKPGKVLAIAIMTLAGGVVAAIIALVNFMLTFVVCVTSLTAVYGTVVAVLCIIKGANLLGARAHLESPPKTTAILQIIEIISCDFVNLVLGILILVFLGDPEVKAYFRGE